MYSEHDQGTVSGHYTTRLPAFTQSDQHSGARPRHRPHLRAGWRLCLAALGICLIGAALPGWAAKPSPRPTPTCTSSLGQPTLAFSWYNQIYVGNASGSCSLALTPINANAIPALALNGSRYRVVWVSDNRDEVKLLSRMRYTVKMVEFTMNNGNIVEPRPLAVKELWRDSVSTSESSVDVMLSLDASGEQVIFRRAYAGETQLKSIDLRTCTPSCAAPTTVWIPEQGATAFRAVFGRAGDQRIYARQTLSSGEQQVFFIEKIGAAWLGPRVIASTEDAVYGAIYWFGRPSVARLDWDGLDGAEDLIALLWLSSNDGSSGYFDVLRLGPNCTLAGAGDGTCLSTGDAWFERRGIWAGWIPASAEWTPTGNLLRTIDPPNDIYGDDHIQTVDPHTGEYLWDHGYGLNPVGLKQ